MEARDRTEEDWRIMHKESTAATINIQWKREKCVKGNGVGWVTQYLHQSCSVASCQVKICKNWEWEQIRIIFLVTAFCCNLRFVDKGVVLSESREEKVRQMMKELYRVRMRVKIQRPYNR